MKNKVYTFVLAAFCLLYTNANAQEATAKLSDAEKAYSSHDLENTRFVLQQALNEINKAIGKDILGILPAKLNDMPYNQKDDNVTGTTGFSGLYVNRTYGEGEKTAKIDIMSDSPLLTSLNALLAMPMIMGSANSNEKRIKVSGYKAMLQKEGGEGNPAAYTLQIPLNQTLLTLHVSGNPSENDVMNMANTLPLDQISKLAQ